MTSEMVSISGGHYSDVTIEVCTGAIELGIVDGADEAMYADLTVDAAEQLIEALQTALQTLRAQG